MTAFVRRLRFAIPGVGLVVAALAGCKTYPAQLARSQRAFEQNDHERSLTLLRDLEPDLKHFGPAEQAEYAYLRGMADYRIGYRADARHWLMIAKADDDASPGMLPPDWKARTAEALTELNTVVFSDGTSALASPRPADANAAKDPKRASDDEEPAKPRRKKPKPDAADAPP